MICEYFSQSLSCPFILRTVFFKEHEFFMLMKPNFSIGSLMDHVIDAVSKKSLPRPQSGSSLTVVSLAGEGLASCFLFLRD